MSNNDRQREIEMLAGLYAAADTYAEEEENRNIAREHDQQHTDTARTIARLESQIATLTARLDDLETNR